ncbi:MAG: hypothetical protein JW947_08175 [Sedimentisphaerales bacterium]|nr:hypothetical protein [Sedimentisphaerales bacterium]
MYNKLGYSPYVDRETEQIVGELKSLVDVEILEIAQYDEFHNALTELRGFYEKYPDEESKLTGEERQFIENLLSNKDDREKIIAILNEGRLWQKHLRQYDHLFVKRGRITGKERFLELLEKLNKIFNKTRLPLSREHYLSVIDKIDEIRNLTKEDDDSVDADLVRSLEYEVESACVTLDNTKTGEKKHALDDLLCSLVSAQRRYKPSDANFMDITREQADIYLKSHWMHTPLLTEYLLSLLLKAEVSRLRGKPVSKLVAAIAIIGVVILIYLDLTILAVMWFAVLFVFEFVIFKNAQKAAVLNKIYNEINSGHYDGDELARRLQKLEKKKVFVQSITYSLLHLRQSEG